MNPDAELAVAAVFAAPQRRIELDATPLRGAGGFSRTGELLSSDRPRRHLAEALMCSDFVRVEPRCDSW